MSQPQREERLQTAQWSRKKLWSFRFILMALPVIFLLSLEFGLRLFDYGPNLELFIPHDKTDGYLTGSPTVALRYFSAEGQTDFGTGDLFAQTKKAQTLRIFVLGGSTTAGFPYFNNGSFSRMLEDRLVQAYPNYNLEIINLGMTAVNSYTVRDFARECLDHEPDLIVIYAGHNEFYGALGSGSTQGSVFGSNRNAILVYLQLKQLKLFQLVQELTNSVGGLVSGSNDDGAGQTLMARMVEDQAIAYDSPIYQQTLANYRTNLLDSIKWAGAKKVPVLLGTLTSNVKDQSPFVSIHTANVDVASFDDKLVKAKASIAADDHSAACPLVDELRTIDPTHALTLFLSGRCAEQRGEYDAAKDYYELARDRDGLRFRASRDINRILRELSQAEDVYLSEVEAVMEQASPHGLIGTELMLEHLHPNLEGYFLIAKAFAETILSDNLLFKNSAQIEPAPKPALSDAAFRSKIAVTPLDLRKAEYNIEVLMSGWPFEEHRRFKSLDDFKPATKLDEVALDILRKKIKYWDANLVMIDHYQQTGDIEAAIDQAAALLKAFPKNGQSYKVMGIALVNAQRYEEALPYLLTAVETIDDGFAHKWLGTIMLMQNRPVDAVPYLKKAVARRPDDHRARYDLAYAYSQTGRRELALAELEKVLLHNPDLANARDFYLQLKNN